MASHLGTLGRPARLSGTLTLDLRFPGQLYQIETGLHYNWHRHYDPVTGRYTQPDPLRFVDGPSVYAYAGSSPFVRVDPTGLAPNDNWYGFPRAFWNWFHRHPDFESCKEAGGQVPRNVAKDFLDEWDRRGRPGPGSGY